jgi:phage protein D
VTIAPSELVAVPPDFRYAPDFAVYVDGEPVDERTRDDVLSIRVDLDIGQMSSFDITFNNWDERTLRFKYAESDAQNERFAIGRRVQVHMGYAGRLLPMVTGTIMGLNPSFPESGATTIGISGTDGMQRLKKRKPKLNEPRLYRNVRDDEIAKIIAGRSNLDVRVDEGPEKYTLVVQKNQDDAMFLMERAKRIDFECYVRTDPETKKETLHFEQARDGRPGVSQRVYQLAYGPGLAAAAERSDNTTPVPAVPNLIEFTPSLRVADQVTAVAVRGWDPKTKRPISYTATAGDLPGGGKGLSGPQAAGVAVAGREDAVVDAPVHTTEEARRLAISILREQAYTFITGTGRIAGLPELGPGDSLDIHGIGRRFSGAYFVTGVQHTVGAGGYFTQFRVRRTYDGSR